MKKLLIQSLISKAMLAWFMASRTSDEREQGYLLGQMDACLLFARLLAKL